MRAATYNPSRIIIRHPIVAVSIAFLGGVGVGALLSHQIGQIRDSVGEKRGGVFIRLLLTLVTPYIVRRLIW